MEARTDPVLHLNLNDLVFELIGGCTHSPHRQTYSGLITYKVVLIEDKYIVRATTQLFKKWTEGIHCKKKYSLEGNIIECTHYIMFAHGYDADVGQ